MSASVREFSGIILKANNGLKTKFDTSSIKFKNTFAKAKKLGVDLNNTTKMFKKNGTIFLVSVTQYSHKGRNYESVNVFPYLNLN